MIRISFAAHCIPLEVRPAPARSVFNLDQWCIATGESGEPVARPMTTICVEHTLHASRLRAHRRRPKPSGEDAKTGRRGCRWPGRSGVVRVDHPFRLTEAPSTTSPSDLGCVAMPERRMGEAQSAHEADRSLGTLKLVPGRRTCRVQSFASSQLCCPAKDNHHNLGPRSRHLDHVAPSVLRGDHRIRIWVGHHPRQRGRILLVRVRAG